MMGVEALTMYVALASTLGEQRPSISGSRTGQRHRLPTFAEIATILVIGSRLEVASKSFGPTALPYSERECADRDQERARSDEVGKPAQPAVLSKAP
jgi:hypothetical protein